MAFLDTSRLSPFGSADCNVQAQAWDTVRDKVPCNAVGFRDLASVGESRHPGQVLRRVVAFGKVKGMRLHVRVDRR